MPVSTSTTESCSLPGPYQGPLTCQGRICQCPSLAAWPLSFPLCWSGQGLCLFLQSKQACISCPGPPNPRTSPRGSREIPPPSQQAFVALGFVRFLCFALHQKLAHYVSIHLLGKFQKTAFFKVGIQGNCAFIDSAGSLFGLGSADPSAS